MDSGFDARLDVLEVQHRQDLQRLNNLNETGDIKNFMDEMNDRLRKLDDELSLRQQDVQQPTLSSPLSQTLMEEENKIVNKKIQNVKELLELAERKINPEYHAQELPSSFVRVKSNPANRSSLKEPMLSRTRTSSIGETPFKSTRSGSHSSAVTLPTSNTTPMSSFSETQNTSSIPIGSNAIDKEVEEVNRLFEKAVREGYKKENAESISTSLTNIAAILFMQIKLSDIVDPKRHIAIDSTDLRCSQFSNRLGEIVLAQFKRLDVEPKSPKEQQTIMQEKEKLLKMLIKIVEDLRAKNNFLSFLTMAGILEDQFYKKANAQIKNNLSSKELAKVTENLKLIIPPYRELISLQEQLIKEGKSVIPYSGPIKTKFSRIDEFKQKDNTKSLGEKEEAIQIALFNSCQQNLARDLKLNLAAIKLKYSENELIETEQQLMELKNQIIHSRNVDDRHTVYEKIMINLTKRGALIDEQMEYLKIMSTAIGQNQTNNIKADEIMKKLQVLGAKRKGFQDDVAETKNAMLFNESKMIATLTSEQIVEKYSKSLPKLLDQLNTMLAKLADDKIPLSKRIELLKETDLIMHELDIKSKAISHRANNITFTDDKAKQLLEVIRDIPAKQNEFIQLKNSIEQGVGRRESISLISSIRPNT